MTVCKTDILQLFELWLSSPAHGAVALRIPVPYISAQAQGVR